jgi:hypothetical protein
MVESEEPQKPIVISDDDARGAEDNVPTRATLVPMLLWALGLAVVGVIAVMFFMNR